MHKLYDFMEARERLSTITVKTKLLHSDVFSDECENDVYIKPENLQITGSFKVRGAYNKIAKLTEEERRAVLSLRLLVIMHKAWPLPRNALALKRLLLCRNTRLL